MSYLRCLCLFAYSGVQLILCCVAFLFCLSSSCVPYVANFSGLSIFIAPSVFSNVYLSCVLCTLCCHFLWIVHFYHNVYY